MPPTLTFEMQQEGDCFRAFYEWTPRQGEPFAVRSTVRIHRRPCRFGGSRVYFIAPCCGRRVLRLAALASGLTCGTCGRITWSSRREQRLQRLIRKARKLAIPLELAGWRDTPL